MSYAIPSEMSERLQELHNEINRLTEYEDRAEKAEEALRNILNYLEIGNQKTYRKCQDIINSVNCFPFAGIKNNKEEKK